MQEDRLRARVRPQETHDARMKHAIVALCAMLTVVYLLNPERSGLDALAIVAAFTLLVGYDRLTFSCERDCECECEEDEATSDE